MILMLRGLPASGKSTWAKERVKEGNWIRVNKDDIRAMLGVDFSRKTEALVVSIERKIVENALLSGFDVILDNTNLNPVHEEYYKLQGYTVDFKNFIVPVEECIRRDALRANPVGKGVILKMYKKWSKTYPWL